MLMDDELATTLELPYIGREVTLRHGGKPHHPPMIVRL
jgi:hypothetical protein